MARMKPPLEIALRQVGRVWRSLVDFLGADFWGVDEVRRGAEGGQGLFTRVREKWESQPGCGQAASHLSQFGGS